MKLNKFAAAGATLALAVGSVLGLGAAANAIDVPIDQIGVEGESYPAGTWFLGNPVGDPLSQDATGLTIPGQNQLLYGQTTSVASAEAFTTLIGGASFEASGTATFQVPVYFSPDASDEGNAKQFTTLRPETPGTPLTTTNWISSYNLPQLGLTKNTPVPFATIAAAFDDADAVDPEILAFGVFVNPGDEAVLESVTWSGATWTFATPVVTAEVPTPIEDSASFTG